jgi:uncharacterized protein (TIGR00251 family)
LIQNLKLQVMRLGLKPAMTIRGVFGQSVLSIVEGNAQDFNVRQILSIAYGNLRMTGYSHRENVAMASLLVKVTPRASANSLAGWRDGGSDELMIRVTAPAEGGKANAAVVKLLSKELRVAKSAIMIVRGETSRSKLLDIALSENELRKRLDAAI